MRQSDADCKGCYEGDKGMMETKRKTAVAATTTVKNMREKAGKEFPHKDYSTLKEKLQEEIAKFVCISSFWVMYVALMYALYYICCVKG